METPNEDKAPGPACIDVRVNALVMPLGMTKIPFGYPVMFGDFIGFAQWAIGSDEIRDDFQTETGINLHSIIPRNGLEAMIDKATGCTHKETFASFLDWLATELWGEA